MGDQRGEPFFGVVRHAERADAAFAVTHNGAPRWTQTPDCQMWPFDPPLTDEGVSFAGETGLKIQAFAEGCGAKVDIIVSSPYTRCLQTASAICSKLKPTCRILIDYSLGEIYGPSIMGPNEPATSVRTIDQALPQGVRKKQLLSQGKVVGAWPKWPEDPRTARQRFANRFLTHLQRSITTKRNFLLVTHADCVGAALSVMPSHAQYAVEKIDYCGMMLARRSSGGVFSQISKILGITPEDEGAMAEEEQMMKEPEENYEDREGPEAGWQVQTHGVKMHTLTDHKDGRAVFEKRAKALEKNTQFSQDKIKFLLGALDQKPLGDTWEDISVRSHMSDSTLLFNKSANGGSSYSASSGPSALGNSREPMGAAAALMMRNALGKQQVSGGSNGSGEGRATTTMKSHRLARCKDMLALDFQPVGGGEAHPPVMDAAKNSLVARRSAVGLGPLKLSL